MLVAEPALEELQQEHAGEPVLAVLQPVLAVEPALEELQQELAGEQVPEVL